MQNEQLNLSIIICTFNRCESLKDVLNSLFEQKSLENLFYEIIVIDNNSQDETKKMVDEFIPQFNEKLRYVFEQQQGLSFARNRGIRESRGEILVFTDDDVILDSDWIKNIKFTFDTYSADCVFGKIILLWPEKNLPKWLAIDRRLWSVLGNLDYGDTLRTISSPKEDFFGANFAIKKDFLQEMGGFNINLGVKGNKHYLSEETDVFLKLLKNQKKILYNPLVIIYHKVSKNMLTKKYFKKWFYDGGNSLAVKFANARKTILRIPFWFIREYLILMIQYTYYFIIFNRKESFRLYLRLIYYFGALVTFLKKDNYAQSQCNHPNL